jgi:hypothetical protein
VYKKSQELQKAGPVLAGVLLVHAGGQCLRAAVVFKLFSKVLSEGKIRGLREIS